MSCHHKIDPRDERPCVFCSATVTGPTQCPECAVWSPLHEPGDARCREYQWATEIAKQVRRREAAESLLAEVAGALDEFAPSNTGLSLPESVALLRTRLCEVRAEIEAKGGWRERLAEMTRAVREVLEVDRLDLKRICEKAPVCPDIGCRYHLAIERARSLLGTHGGTHGGEGER